jgi:hypothetical protein
VEFLCGFSGGDRVVGSNSVFNAFIILVAFGFRNMDSAISDGTADLSCFLTQRSPRGESLKAVYEAGLMLKKAHLSITITAPERLQADNLVGWCFFIP